jgi:hypothetical protein
MFVMSWYLLLLAQTNSLSTTMTVRASLGQSLLRLRWVPRPR